MDRLSKKCVITSAIVHGTLVLVLLVGPAFLGSDTNPDASQQILTIIPDIAISSGATVIGFGTPNGGRSEPTPPPQPQPRPQPQPQPQPQPPPAVRNEVKDPPKVERTKPVPDKPATESLEALDKPRRPQVSLTPIVRKPSNSTAKPNTSAADERAQARADAQRTAKRLETAMNNIQQGASSSVDVGPPVGVSTGTGRSVGAYSDILRSIYFNGWREPSDATMEDAVVKVSITIRSNGEVISSRITKSSGDQAVDRSVQHLIDSITFVRPFPEDWSERQKEFKLSFSLKAKRSLG